MLPSHGPSKIQCHLNEICLSFFMRQTMLRSWRKEATGVWMLLVLILCSTLNDQWSKHRDQTLTDQWFKYHAQRSMIKGNIVLNVE
jgi:hypothetical protein